MTIPVEKTPPKKTLGLGESEVWSGRGDWACPLTCKVFLFFFGFLEWNAHLLVTTLGFFSLFQFSRSDLEESEMWAGVGDWACPLESVFCDSLSLLEWHLHLPAPTLGFMNLFKL